MPVGRYGVVAEVIALFVLGILGNQISDTAQLRGTWLALSTIAALLLAISISYRLRQPTRDDDLQTRQPSQRAETLTLLLLSIPVGAGIALLAISLLSSTVLWFGSPGSMDGVVIPSGINLVHAGTFTLFGVTAFIIFGSELIAFVWAAMFLGLVAYFQRPRDAATMGFGFALVIPAVLKLRDWYLHDALYTVVGGALAYATLGLAFPAIGMLIRIGRTAVQGRIRRLRAEGKAEAEEI